MTIDPVLLFGKMLLTLQFNDGALRHIQQQYLDQSICYCYPFCFFALFARSLSLTHSLTLVLSRAFKLCTVYIYIFVMNIMSYCVITFIMRFLLFRDNNRGYSMENVSFIIENLNQSLWTCTMSALQKPIQHYFQFSSLYSNWFSYYSWNNS